MGWGLKIIRGYNFEALHFNEGAEKLTTTFSLII